MEDVVFKRIIRRHSCHACGLKCRCTAFVQQLSDGSVRFWHQICVKKIQNKLTKSEGMLNSDHEKQTNH